MLCFKCGFITARFRVVLGVCFLLLASLGAYAATADKLLAYEPFDSSTGPLNNTSSGAGWSGNWFVQNGSTDESGYAVAPGFSLAYPDLPTAGSLAAGGLQYLTAGRKFDNSVNGSFAGYVQNNLIGITGQTLWLSLLMEKDSDTEDQTSVTLHTNAVPWHAQTPLVSAGYFGSSSDANSLRYWSLMVGNTVYRSTTPVNIGQAVFLVMRLDFGATSKVTFYVNPIVGSAAPAVPDLQVSTALSLSFNALAYYAGTQSQQSSVDEIRVGTSFAAVTTGTGVIPSSPGAVCVTPGNGQAVLSWNPVPGATSYQVWRDNGNGSTQLIATVPNNTYTVTGLQNGAAYKYFVAACNNAGTGPLSAPVIATGRITASPAQPALGTNLSQIADWSRELPFVDAFKSARPWISQKQGTNWGQGGPLQLTPQGWIASLQPGQYAETIMLDNRLNDQADYPTGQYILLYDGSGTLAFDLNSATIMSQTPGRMVVNVPAGGNGIYLMVTGTDPSNPIRNIRFIMPGFEQTYQTQPFNPQLLAMLKNYKGLRFMEWMLTNGSTVQSWQDRPLTTDYTYMWRGVPLEVMVRLANTLGADPWFNMPHLADNNFIAGFANLVNQQLSPTLKAYVEYSNETWNSLFSQSAYVQAQGTALGLSQDPVLAGVYYSAARSVQVFDIWRTTTGGLDRFVRVLASQSANLYLAQQMLQYNNAYLFADALATAPYFSCSDFESGGWGFLGDPSTAAQVAAMSPDQILDIETQHIGNCALDQMQSAASIAARYGVKLVAYEGGQHLVGIGSVQNNQPLAQIFQAANRSSRMATLYTQYLNNWTVIGGDFFFHFKDVEAYTEFGSWGALERIDQNPATAPKYQALIQFAQQNP